MGAWKLIPLNVIRHRRPDPKKTIKFKILGRGEWHSAAFFDAAGSSLFLLPSRDRGASENFEKFDRVVIGRRSLFVFGANCSSGPEEENPERRGIFGSFWKQCIENNFVLPIRPTTFPYSRSRKRRPSVVSHRFSSQYESRQNLPDYPRDLNA